MDWKDENKEKEAEIGPFLKNYKSAVYGSVKFYEIGHKMTICKDVNVIPKIFLQLKFRTKKTCPYKIILW